MSKTVITLDSITKYYSDRCILKNINYSLETDKIYAINGDNGSGKTTLLKIMATIIPSTSGLVNYTLNGVSVKKKESLKNNIGYFAPYLNLYDEFDAYENLNHIYSIRGVKVDNNVFSQMGSDLGLLDIEDKPLKSYSTGMKQKLKFIFTVLHNPDFIFLDEPRTNLDDKGIQYIYNYINEHKKDKIVVMATNSIEDINISDEIIEISKYKE